MGNSLWSVQDAKEELWLCPSWLQPTLLPKGEWYKFMISESVLFIDSNISAGLYQFLFTIFLGKTQEYLDTQRSRHIPPPVSLEHTLLPTIISAQ